jgi:hypothetical protein
MFDFIFGNLVAASKDPGDTINNLLEIAVPIFFAAVWILGAIMKASKGAKQNQQGGFKPKTPKKQPDFDDLLRNIQQRFKAVREQAQKAAQQQQARLEPPVQPPLYKSPSPPPLPPPPKPAAPAFIPAAPQPEPQPVAEQAQMAPIAEQVYEEMKPILASPFEKDHIIYTRHPYWKDLTEELKHPESLRKLILYTEILGPPVALRD